MFDCSPFLCRADNYCSVTGSEADCGGGEGGGGGAGRDPEQLATSITEICFINFNFQIFCKVMEAITNFIKLCI